MSIEPSLLAAATAFEQAQSITNDQTLLVLSRGLEMMARALDQRLKTLQATMEMLTVVPDDEP
jgi:hypothetical protein